MRLMLDTNILGRLCRPRKHPNEVAWLLGLLQLPRSKVELVVPEIGDYELRRELIRLLRSNRQEGTRRSLERLDKLAVDLGYCKLDTETMRKAAELWADARATGRPTAAAEALDGDVILAAQAIRANAAVVTDNTKHLARFVTAFEWSDVAVSAASLAA